MNKATESANSVNQLTNQSGTSTSISYDLAGNETTKIGSAGGYVFDWDGANRCTAIGSSDFQFSIAYDGLNRWTHITQCDANCTNLLADRWFVWNGNTLTEERDSSGTLIQRFYANGFWRAGTNYFYIRDHLGSVRQVTDQNGTTVAKFNYDPYGRRTQTFGTMWIDYGYAGLFELTSGLKLAVWRIYDPSTGRWINRDPIREQGGWNLYAYCGGNPVMFNDSTGENRRRYVMLLHAWIEVDTYDSNGQVNGIKALNWSARGFEVTTRESVLYDVGLGLPGLNTRLTEIESNQLEDEALLNYWENAEATPNQRRDEFNYWLNNCFETSSSLLYYGTRWHPHTYPYFSPVNVNSIPNIRYPLQQLK